MRNGQRDGLNFFEALTLALIILKLCGIINWGWLMVFVPILTPIVTGIIYVWIKAVKFTIKKTNKEEK